MNEDFKFELCSDLDYEEMVVYISWKETPIALLNCEKGVHAMDLELLSTETNSNNMKFSLNEFLEALKFAENILRKK